MHGQIGPRPKSGCLAHQLDVVAILAPRNPAQTQVGDPAIVFLDEPTTGLDPETKRNMWALVEKSKRGRVIVLTTHSMEEADALCTRIGIMAGGELRCLGTSTHVCWERLQTATQG